MKGELTSVAIAALLVVALPVLGGCSVIWAGLTAGDNAVSSRRDAVPLHEIESVEVDRPLVVRLDDGSDLHGRYAGYDRASASLLLTISNQDVLVSVDAIVEVHTVKQKHNVWAAFATGALVDLVFLHTITNLSFGVGIGE